MNQDRKYFGMTNSQLGIIGGLAFLLCCLFVLAGWLIFGNGIDLSRPPAIPPTLASTPTLIVIPTLTPTSLPTPIPYEQLIPQGWKQHKTSLIEVWLPTTFKAAQPKIPEGGIEFAILELVLSQPAAGTSLYNEWFVVLYEPLVGNSLDSYLDGELSTIPPEFRMVERRKTLVNSTEAIRLVFETRVEATVDANLLTYVFLDGTTIWYVEYFAQINEFYELLPTFEQSAKTFRVVR